MACLQVSSYHLRGINPTQGDQRGNKGQLEAVDIKKTLTSADSSVEDSEGIAR